MELSNFPRVRLTIDYKIKQFDCEDRDLNEFLFKDAFDYLYELLAVTYLFETKNETVAFYSVINDKISCEIETSKSKFKKISRGIPHPKRWMKSYPAVKIARLGVSSKYQGEKVGSQILQFVKYSFIEKNKTGCRFITLDAYNEANVIEFYKKNGFDFLTTNDENDKTRLMYFDLKTFARF